MIKHNYYLIDIIGVINKLEWRLGEALEYYKTSLTFALKQNNKYAQGRLYNNMANILEIQMDYQEAIEKHKLHLGLAIMLSDRDGIVKSCGAIASLYHTIHDIPNTLR